MKFLRKSLSAFLVLCMLVSTLPISAVAAPDMRGVMLDSFTVSIDGGNPVSLLSSGSSLNLELGESYTFALRFNHPDEVRNAYVVSEKDNEKRYLEATNNGSGIFVTSGYFGDDRSYVPGTLSVEFSKTGKPLQEDIIWSSLQSPLNQNDVTITTNTEGSVRGTADVSELMKDGAETVLDFSVDVLNTLSGTDVDLGVYKDLFSTIKDLEKGEVYCITPDENWYEPGTYVAFVKDASDANKYIKMALDVTGDRPKSLSKVSEELSTYKDIISLMADFVEIQDEKAKLSEQIEKSPFIQDKNEALGMLDSYVRDRQIFSMIVTLLPAVALASGGTMTVPALIFKYYFKAMEKSADYFWDYRVGMILGCSPVEGAFLNNNEHGAGWCPLTNNYLKENGWSISNGNYYLAEDISLLSVKENSTNTTICLHGHTIEYGLTIADDATVKLYDCKYIEHSNGTTSGGGILGNAAGTAISNSGNLHINNCIVEGPLSNYGGKVTIAGGMYTGSEISNDGTMNITGGTIATGRHGFECIGNAGTLNISGGTILNTKDATDCITNGSEGVANITGGIIQNTGTDNSYCVNNFGTLIIKDGLLENTGAQNRDRVAINQESGTMEISGGNLRAFGEGNSNNEGVWNKGEMLVKGGTISAKGEGIINYGKLNMQKGSVESKKTSAIKNLGEMSLCGGTLKALGDRLYGLENSDGGILSISGGTLQGPYGALETSSNESGSVVISGGTFIGPIYVGYRPAPVKFLINATSRIEITTSFNAVFNSAIDIEAASGYNGGVMYYDELEGSGVPMTITQLSEILAAAPENRQLYVRLVANDAVDKPDPIPGGDDKPDCQHSYAATVTAPTCTEQGYTTHTCTKCGHSYQDNYVNALGHRFGEWIVVREATSTTDGSRERTCAVCNYKETSTIPATGSSSGGSGSSGGGSSSSSDSSSSGSDRGSSASSGYQISSSKDVTGGRVNLSRTNAVTGQAVTVVVHPDDGYELDTLKVLDSSGKELSLRKQNGRYVFIMPSGKVSVEATFRPIGQATNDTQTPNADFSDIPNGYWAEDAINWTRSNGYMNGITDSTFNPEGTITRQQLCMILSRLSGQSPSGMAEARIWAMNSGLTDGTKSGAPATRQQMVTFLYRYCRMMNYPITSGGDLTAFPDYASASNYAREALAWAVGNGIITGIKAGKLNPGGFATRAQFAVILQRFANTVVEG